MNKGLYTLFVAFCAVILTLLVVAWMQSGQPGNAAAETDGEPVYTLADVATHDRLDDCWMVIEGMVYDFTAYVPRHPAPPQVMEVWCGREATAGMREKGDAGRPHGEYAWSLLAQYRIGTLAD